MILYNSSITLFVLTRCCYYKAFYFTILNQKAFYKLSSFFKAGYNLDIFHFLALVGIF